MRVLHIGKYFPPDLGGMEVFLADLVAAQQGQGLDVAALVHGEPRPDDPDWLIRVPVATTLVYAPIAVGFRQALVRAIRRFRPDILHLHLPNNSALWALTITEARELPWVVHWHSDVVVSRIRGAVALAYRAYRPFEQAVLERAERIIATSPDYLDASEPLAPWRDKCTVVPLGIDRSRLSATPAATGRWHEGSLRLLSIGRLTYYKGFDTLIRAVAPLSGVHLVIAGSGELREELDALIAELTPTGSPPHITLAGAISDEEKSALLASCDVFCLASCERTEAFGVVVMEAMHFARPCLTSELAGSGLPWLVRNSGAGQTLPVGDVAVWRAAIEHLRERPAELQQWGQAGQRALQDRFEITPCAREIDRLYDEVAPPPAFPTQQPLIVIPARNESATIGTVLDTLRGQGWEHIVVISDQSTDDTAAIARAAGATVLEPVLPLGAWGAMQAGIRYAVRHGHQQVITIDADGQHEPACIPALLEAARTHDVVIGACPERGSRSRRIAWAYFRVITGFAIEDLTSGFRCYNRAACEVLADEEATLLDYQDLGVLLLLRQAGLSITEVPVDMYLRVSGPSRIFGGWSRILRYMLESSVLCLARWHPKHHFRR